jgi:hypothetical protein
MAHEPSEEEKCRLVTEVAVEQAMEKCGSEEAVRRQLMRIVGLSEDLDPDCEASLEEGLDEPTLQSTRATRQWVMCRAWNLVQDEDRTLSAGVSQAWAEAKAEGDKQGYEV